MSTLEEKVDALHGKLTLMQRDMQMIRMRIYGPPAYVIDMDHPQSDVANSLMKKITGRTFKPGEIIRLTHEEFELYRNMETCPPHRP